MPAAKLCVIPITSSGGRFSFWNFFPYNGSVFMKVAALLHHNVPLQIHTA